MLSQENIIDEINKDIVRFEENSKGLKYDLYMCRFNLFQFFQLKYMDNKNQNYIGYIMQTANKGKKQYTLENTVIGTLRSAGILTEVDDIEINEYFYELINQFYSERELEHILSKIIQELNIECTAVTNFDKFCTIKDFDKNVFTTYYRTMTQKGELSKNKKIKDNAYFHFRYFRLSDKYAPFEEILWEGLKKEFGWRLKYELVRNF